MQVVPLLEVHSLMLSLRSKPGAQSLTFGTLDWLGMVTMRIQRPRMRRPFTALKLCDPPLTCMTEGAKLRAQLPRPHASNARQFPS